MDLRDEMHRLVDTLADQAVRTEVHARIDTLPDTDLEDAVNQMLWWRRLIVAEDPRQDPAEGQDDADRRRT
jgi:hypothetical protein